MITLADFPASKRGLNRHVISYLSKGLKNPNNENPTDSIASKNDLGNFDTSRIFLFDPNFAKLQKMKMH